MCGTLTNQARREEWVSCVVLICFTLCIPTSALPARPLPVVSGKPHGAKTYKSAWPSDQLETCNSRVVLTRFHASLNAGRGVLVARSASVAGVIELEKSRFKVLAK